MWLYLPSRFARRVAVATAPIMALWALSAVPSPVRGQPAKDKDQAPKAKESKAKEPPVKLGLSINDPKAFQGFTLLAPFKGTKTYLIDMQGKVVRTWAADCNPALVPYLLENGNLLRPGEIGAEAKAFQGVPGTGGRVQEFTWDGALVWDFKFYNEKQLPHHDITRLPNGNVMLIVYDKKTLVEAITAGRRPNAVGTHFLPDSLVEIKPTGATSGEVVWEWRLWDHLVQDHDKDKANFGKVAEHPELVDINFGQDVVGQFAAKKGGLDALKGIGYVGNTPKGKGPNADWTHFNAVAYNADLDQLVVSVHAFCEIWIIDHSTTTSEAAGHKGGRSGKGGDLLYRWGNPRAYGTGTKAQQRLFAQHNAHWIAKGLPGEGHLLVFNNGGNRPDGSYSSVDELVLPVNAEGQYSFKTGTAYGPDKAVWSYSAPKKNDFYSPFISGTQRLANGNTLICSGANGTIFEVTPEKEMVWKYINPVKDGPGGPGGKGPGGKGPGGFGGPPQPGQILPSFLQDMLKLTDDQKKKMEEFQKDVTGKLDKILTDEQNKQFKEAKPGFGTGGFGAAPQPGQIISPFLQTALKLGDDQKKQVAELQKETDGRLDTLLGDEQKKQLKYMHAGGFGPGMFGGPGGGPPGGASLFRAYRYAATYPGLVGRDLTPGKTVEELQPKEQKAKEAPAEQPQEVPAEAGRQLMETLGPAFMVFRDKVQKDIKVSDEQQQKLAKRFPDTVQDAMQFFEKLGDKKPEEREKEHQAYRQKAQEKLAAFLKKTLKDEQRKRLRQLELQQEGPFALVARPDLGKELKITDEQREKFMAVIQGMEKKIQPLIKEAQSGGNPQEIMPKIMKIRNEHGDRIEAILSGAQRKQWQEIRGKPLDLDD